MLQHTEKALTEFWMNADTGMYANLTAEERLERHNQQIELAKLEQLKRIADSLEEIQKNGLPIEVV